MYSFLLLHFRKLNLYDKSLLRLSWFRMGPLVIDVFEFKKATKRPIYKPWPYYWKKSLKKTICWNKLGIGWGYSDHSQSRDFLECIENGNSKLVKFLIDTCLQFHFNRLSEMKQKARSFDVNSFIQNCTSFLIHFEKAIFPFKPDYTREFEQQLRLPMLIEWWSPRISPFCEF